MSILMGKFKNLTDLLLWIIMFVKKCFCSALTSILHFLAQLVTFLIWIHEVWTFEPVNLSQSWKKKIQQIDFVSLCFF